MRDAKPLTGRKVLFIALAAFATVIAANMTMMMAATGSFPGLVVKNAYVEGQGWNDRAKAQRALGWTVSFSYREGALQVDLGPGSDAVAFDLTIGRPSSDRDDQRITLSPGQREVPLALEPGAWRIEIVSTSGPAYRASAQLVVPEAG
ncbi:MAG: FixH family protein [Pseudomonadota bacterium]